jgi:hypothetical protein
MYSIQFKCDYLYADFVVIVSDQPRKWLKHVDLYVLKILLMIL